uniref:Uncharacterized protein n=1 Tax=Schistocephalus solidus TaxID=70667 RepID=A0A0V0J7X8_SCHSO
MASEDGRFVGVSPVLHLFFVRFVLLGKYQNDICVVIFTPFLVWMICASEFFERAVIGSVIGVANHLDSSRCCRSGLRTGKSSRSLGHPCCLLAFRKAGARIGHQEVMFRAGSKKKEAVVVIPTETTGT